MARKYETPFYRKPAVLAVGAVLLAAAGFLLYHVTSPGGISSGVVGFKACKLVENNYRLAKFFDAQGKLDMTIYTYSYDDQTTEELLLAAKNQGAAPQALYHNFYKTDLCQNLTSCDGIVLDVGANLGTHGLYLAKMGYEVHAFEPLKNAAELLRCSASANNFKNLFVIQEGISDHVGTECLIDPALPGTHLALFAPRSIGNCSHYKPAQLNVVSIDHYWTTVLEKRPITFIKIDAEAHELFVWQGASQLLAEAPPAMILMEYYPKMLMLKSVPASDLIDLIYDSSYRIWDCQGKVEVVKGAAGTKILNRYQETVTDLLLLHTSKFPAGSKLKRFRCGY